MIVALLTTILVYLVGLKKADSRKQTSKDIIWLSSKIQLPEGHYLI